MSKNQTMRPMWEVPRSNSVRTEVDEVQNKMSLPRALCPRFSGDAGQHPALSGLQRPLLLQPQPPVSLRARSQALGPNGQHIQPLGPPARNPRGGVRDGGCPQVATGLEHL